MQIYRKIKNLLDYAKESNRPLIDVENFTFLNDYRNKYETFDNYIRLKYSNREIYSEIYMKDEEELSSVYSSWLLYVKAYVTSNEYKYKTLYETINFSYNPIENYDRKEDIQTIRTPNLQTESNITSIYGNGEVEEQLGNISNSNSLTGSISPWDSENFNNKNKNINEFTQASITNKTINKTKTDTQDNASLLSGTDTTKVTTNVHGNIGVTSSQDMIKQEREVALFSFYETFFKDIINFTTESIIQTSKCEGRLYMQVLFYTIKDDIRKLEKELFFNSEKSVTLKEDSDLMNLKVEVDVFENWTEINYVYVTGFKRYYFVTNRMVNTGGTITLELHEDVLMTHKDRILNLTCYILRQENLYNNYFVDDKMPVRCDYWISTEKIGQLGNGTGNCIAFNVLNNQIRA